MTPHSTRSAPVLSESMWVRLASMGFAGFHEKTVLQEPHLLMVQTRGFTESYTRLAYADITGIFVGRDRRWLQWLLVPLFEIVVALFMVMYTVQTKAWVPLEIFWVWIALAVLKLVFNLAAGPTCTVVVQTAVQQVQLTGVHRWRNVQAKLEPLRAEILRAQGQMPQAQQDQVIGQLLQAHPQQVAWDKGTLHLCIGVAQLLTACAILLYFFTASKISFFLFACALASAGLFALIAVRRQQDQPLFGLLAGAAWAGLAWWFISLAMFFGTVIYVALIDDLIKFQFSIEPYVHYFQVDLRTYPIVNSGYLLVLIAALLLSLLTFFSYFGYRKRYQRGHQ